MEYVAEQRDPDEPTNSVVFAALRLIESMKEQLTTEQIAEIDDCLQTTRGFRFDECLSGREQKTTLVEPARSTAMADDIQVSRAGQRIA